MNTRALFLSALATTSLFAQTPAQPAPQTPVQPPKILRIGATSVPQADLLRAVSPELERQGVQLQIVVYEDWSIPNIDVARAALDANFHQTEPYLWRWRGAHGAPLVVAGRVHIERMGIYSKKLKALTEIHDGGVVAVPDDPANLGRALALLQKAGLIYTNDRKGLDAGIADIIQNPHGLKFRVVPGYKEVEQLGSSEIVVVNGNYALEGNLAPPLFREGPDSHFPNVVVTREDMVHDKRIELLVAALRGPTARQFLLEKYPGTAIMSE
jgi:D-methionine transport system substrate-binding protein